DYGLVVPEAFRARKPVITTTDGGGTLEFVKQADTGWVVEPEPEVIAMAIAQAMRDQKTCSQLGEAGHEQIAFLSWDYVIQNLTEGL
ncbi:MAG TPA: glycosyltransferase, partial [Anaerolineales bacterium]